MGTIGYGYGSEWHLLRFLGYHRDHLQNIILESTGGSQIEWMDCRFSPTNQLLHLDPEWKGIEFINQPEVQQKWAHFWPQTGNAPNWDAVGKLKSEKGEEWLLVEAKAHVEEIHSSCGATNPKSKELIKNALLTTQVSLNSKAEISQWLSPYYQFCNRLAVLHFLMNECQPRISARLIFIYFYGDKIGGCKCPQKAQEWNPAIQEMYKTVDLDKSAALFQNVHSIFLPVNPNIGK